MLLLLFTLDPTYTIITEEYLFIINETTGEITTNSSQFDREEINLYRITVQTTSENEFLPENSNSVFVYVYILDINDVTPSFTPSLYSFDFDENSQSNFLVGTVIAVDTDELGTPNSDIRFSIEFPYINSSVEGPYLSINAESGEVLVTGNPIDYELHRNITVSITARDLGSPPLEETIQFVIIVNDLNDNSPIFTESTYTFSVEENSANGTLVNAVFASDRDAGTNAELSFSFQGNVSICLFAYKQTININKHINKNKKRLTNKQTSK